ncbi:hypothetical protein NBRC116598_10190 [Pseudophaeobacter arcticus]|uniref:Uncharacterized protein n=1 Tax=Pseudophaeobacter arcticus TaxID=385492 RepID=A0ABQ0AI70_9RHOB
MGAKHRMLPAWLQRHAKRLFHVNPRLFQSCACDSQVIQFHHALLFWPHPSRPLATFKRKAEEMIAGRHS